MTCTRANPYLGEKWALNLWLRERPEPRGDGGKKPKRKRKRKNENDRDVRAVARRENAAGLVVNAVTSRTRKTICHSWSVSLTCVPRACGAPIHEGASAAGALNA